MNERIDQLWAQALDLAVPETYISISYIQALKIKQVFAELIVQECLEACRVACEIKHPTPPSQQQVVWSCMREIEETFRS